MPKLYPEDQERVDQVLSEGIYSEERPPFRFFKLLGILTISLVVVSIIGVALGWYFGFI